MKVHINWNALGFSAALICAIHCALFPLFISSLPLLGISIFHNIFFESGMILVAFFIGSISLWHGYRRHHHRPVAFIFFTAGMILLVINQFNHEIGLVIIVPASLFIITAYYLNWRFCRIAKHCHTTDCNH